MTSAPKAPVVPTQRDNDTILSRRALGLQLPDLSCWRCRVVLVILIFWDEQSAQFCCHRCAAHIARSHPSAIKSVTIDARGRIPNVDYIPAGRAIALLIQHGAQMI